MSAHGAWYNSVVEDVFKKSHILGHERQRKYMDAAIRNGRLAHAFVFYGPAEVGKRTLAQEIAKKLFCTRACGECQSCRQIDEHTHPAVFSLGPDHTLVSKKEKRKDIPIEDIRELKRRFSFAPEGDRWRVAILDDADTMSRAAANAFLKLLEEPGSRTLLVLVTSSREALLPTILSRAQQIRFSTLSDAILRAYLEHYVKDADAREEYCAIANGRPGRLLRMLGDSEYAEREKKFLRDMAFFFRGRNAADAFRLSERMIRDETLRQRAVEYVFRKLRKDALRASASDARYVASKIRRVDAIVEMLETTNVNPRLATDVLLLESVG